MSEVLPSIGIILISVAVFPNLALVLGWYMMSMVEIFMGAYMSEEKRAAFVIFTIFLLTTGILLVIFG